MMKSAEIRRLFIDFFRAKGHEVVPSSPLIPANDATLLFTNAGMVQFKDVFLGREQRSYTRAVSAQRCVRAGGKHNDLENVGYTARHHTFFEMLGNFSFGDYFKREAIQYSWEFLTEVLQIPAEKLWISIYQDDDEAADIWLKDIKVDPQRFSRCGDKDNFWAMGDTGPCGPCSEIFYDHGADIAGGPPGSAEQEGDRYIEIWNLVFTQYNRSADGKLNPIPKPSVDTGMGLERLAAVMQGVHNNYDTDLFQPLIAKVAEIAGVQDQQDRSLRVIADHIRSCAFLIVDGIVPSNEGRGYVLRRIIRRAIRHGHKLGLHDPFFHRLVAPLITIMSDAYPELPAAQQRVEKILLQEEQQFDRTLDQGLKIFAQEVAQLKQTIIPGEVIFRLYDTYGFPVDLTADMARERDLTLDIAGFEQAMAKQRQLSQQASQFERDYHATLTLAEETIFSGYEKLHDSGKVIALLKDNTKVNVLKAGDQGGVILDTTPFYAQGGGQVGDQGVLTFADGVFEVVDTQQHGNACVHYGTLQAGTLNLGSEVTAEVDSDRRQAIVLNHSATHLLHAALRHVLGDHVIQKGSLVAADRLRFDFSHFEPVKPEQLAQIETLVNQQIRANVPSDTATMSLDEAKASGALALFGEKYAERVRVLRMGEFSTEVCGGTHVQRTGDIGVFKIIAETGIAAGIRRIEAVTGSGALAWFNAGEKQLTTLMQLLHADRETIADKTQQILAKQRTLEKTLHQLKTKLAAQAGDELTNAVRDINGIKVLAAHLVGADQQALRSTLDRLKQKFTTAAIVLAAVDDGKVRLVAGVSKDTTAKIKAGELVNFVAEQVGGKGGGRPDMAQAGGNKPEALDAALQSVYAWVEGKLTE